MELCNRQWLKLPQTKGGWLNRVGQRFGTRSEVPATNSPIGNLQLHKDPSRKATPALPDFENPHYAISQSVCLGMVTSLALRRLSIPRTHISALGHMVSWPRRSTADNKGWSPLLYPHLCLFSGVCLQLTTHGDGFDSWPAEVCSRPAASAWSFYHIHPDEHSFEEGSRTYPLSMSAPDASRTQTWS